MRLNVFMWVSADSLPAHQVYQVTSETPTSPYVQAGPAAVSHL